jgi:hypothetical protein
VDIKTSICIYTILPNDIFPLPHNDINLTEFVYFQTKWNFLFESGMYKNIAQQLIHFIYIYLYAIIFLVFTIFGFKKNNLTWMNVCL